MALLPHQALKSFASLLNAIKTRTAPPLQMLLNPLSLIPKKTGGERSIATATAIYRVLARCDNDDVVAYEEANAYSRDSAKRGSSASASAEIRALDADMAVSNGFITHQLLWDTENCSIPSKLPSYLILPSGTASPLSK